MNILTEGLRLQAASLGKTLEDYDILKVPCGNCHGTLTDSHERRCTRCDNGFTEVKRTRKETK